MRYGAPLLLLSVLLSSCGALRGDEDAIGESHYASSLRAENGPDMNAVADARDDVDEKVQALEIEISRLSDEDWRDVVPDVEFALQQAEQALQELDDVVGREGVDDRVATGPIWGRLQAIRLQVDGFQDTREWGEAVDGIQGETGFSSELDDLESDLASVSEEVEERYEP